MADVSLVARNVAATPKAYVVPGAQEFVLKAVTAAVDGTGATSAFQPVLQMVSPAGDVMWSAVGDTIAAGGSAAVSWFPGAEVEEEGPGTPSGVVVESLFLDSHASVPVSSSTVLQAGRSYVITVQGTYTEWNSTLTLGTPNADAMFPGSTVGRVSTEVGIDAECCFARSAGPSAFEVGQHTNCFQMNLGSGMQHIEPVGGPYNVPQPNYFYTYNVTGQGSVASFLTTFTPQTDNYGKLLITIQTVGGGSSGGGGGSLLPDPSLQPNGAWLRTSSGTAVWEPTPQVTEADMSLSDVTTQNVSTSKHGFAPKAPNDATKFLDGTGAYSTPSATSGVSSLDGITGAVSLVAGTGVAIADNTPGAGQITIATTGGGGTGGIIAYAKRTTGSPISTIGTTYGTGVDLLPSAVSFTADGASDYLVVVSGLALSVTGGASAEPQLSINLDSSDDGRLGVYLSASTASTQAIPLVARGVIVAPSAGSHTVNIRMFTSSASHAAVAQFGAGGAGNDTPLAVTIEPA